MELTGAIGSYRGFQPLWELTDITHTVRLLKCAALFAIHYSLFTGCSPSTDDIFGGPAATRHEAAIAEYQSILSAPQQGWTIDFYPGDLTIGGIALTARFDGGKVTLACEQPIDNSSVDAKYDAGQEVTSEYRIVSSQGIMLTFDTYNALMHYWSQPSGTDSDGYASDYEFTFVSCTPDSVVLRGRKYGNIMRMYPLRGTSADYLSQVAAIRTTLSDIPRKRAIVDGTSMPVTMMDCHLIYTDAEGKSRNTAYIYTPTGVRFYEPVTLGGVQTLEMTLNSDSYDLVSADRRIQLPMPTLLERFCGTTTQWHFVYGAKDADYDMCDSLRTIVKEAISITGKVNLETVDDIYLGMNKLTVAEDPHRMVLGWSTSISTWSSITYEVCYGIEMTALDESSLTIAITPTERANLFYNYTQIQPMVDFLGGNSPYQLQFNDNVNPTSVIVTSQAHPDLWFKLILK